MAYRVALSSSVRVWSVVLCGSRCMAHLVYVPYRGLKTGFIYRHASTWHHILYSCAKVRSAFGSRSYSIACGGSVVRLCAKRWPGRLWPSWGAILLVTTPCTCQDPRCNLWWWCSCRSSYTCQDLLYSLCGWNSPGCCCRLWSSCSHHAQSSPLLT